MVYIYFIGHNSQSNAVNRSLPVVLEIYLYWFVRGIYLYCFVFGGISLTCCVCHMLNLITHWVDLIENTILT